MTLITSAIRDLDAEALRSAISAAEIDGEPIDSLLDEASSALTDLLEGHS
ncbi:hypothetical protein V8Z69_18330 [Microbacterium aurugineum]